MRRRKIKRHLYRLPPPSETERQFLEREFESLRDELRTLREQLQAQPRSSSAAPSDSSLRRALGNAESRIALFESRLARLPEVGLPREVRLQPTNEGLRLESRLAALEQKLFASAITSAGGSPVPVSVTPFAAFALSQKIDKLNGVIFSGENNFNLTDADIPDGITASNYLPLAGGAVSGALSVTSAAIGTSTPATNVLVVYGSTTIQTWQNVPTAFRILNAATSTVFVVDTLNTRVGVATSSPSDTFALNGAMYFAPISAPSATAHRLYNVANDLYWAGSVIGGATTGQWTTDGTHAWRPSGNVGIGTTSPYAKLSVVGQAVAEYFTATSTTATSTFSGGFVAGNNAALSVNQAASANSLYIAANGNIGIGTAGPVGRLQVNGGNLRDGYNSALEIQPKTGELYPAIIFGGQSASQYSAIQWTTSVSGDNSNSAVASIVALSTSATNADLRFYTNNAIGTAGYSEKVRILGNGNVGIGTTSPAGLLSVSGSSGLMVTNTGSAYTAYFEDAANDTSPVVIDTNGNVGIGTAAPLAMLQISGGYNTAPAFSDGAQLRIVGTGAAGTGNDAVIRFETPSNGRLIYVDESDANKLKFTGGGGTDLVTIDNNGNTGIGTTSPWAKLSVTGASDLGNFGYAGYFTATSTTATSTFSGGFTAGNNAALTVNQAASANSLYIAANGNVGIGIAAPARLFHVNGANIDMYPRVSSTLTNKDAAWESFDGTNAVYSGLLGGAANCGTGNWAVYAGGCRITATQAGNVGIGTTTPAGLLSVSGSSGLMVTNTGSAYTAYFEDAANDTSPVVIDTNGNVGIGTANPLTKFNVVGQTVLGTAVASLDSYEQLDLVRAGDPYLFFRNTNTQGVGNGGIIDFYQKNGGGSEVATSRIFGATDSTHATAPGGRLTFWTMANAGSLTERMRIDGTGNLGIGTTSPWAKLSVTGSSDLGNFGYAGYFIATSTTATSTFSGGFVAGNNAAFSVDQAASANSLYIAANGNVGIGTANPTSLLQLGSGVVGSTPTLTFFGSNQTSDNNAQITFRGEGGNILTTIRQYGGNWSNNGDLIFRFLRPLDNTYTNYDDRFTFSRNGTFTAGQQNGAINGTLRAYNTTGASETVPLIIGNANTGGGSNVAIGFDSYLIGTYLAKIVAEKATQGTDVTGNLHFYTSTSGSLTDKMIILSSGNVGIGTTSPWAKLSVTGASDLGNFGYAGYFTATSTTATSTFSGGFTAGNNAAFSVNQAASANSLYIAANGNVGIGTAGPGSKLEVVGGDIIVGTSGSALQFRNTAGTLINGINNTGNAMTVGATVEILNLVGGEMYLNSGTNRWIQFNAGTDINISSPVPYDLTATINRTDIAYTGFKLNVTEVAVAASGNKLFDVQVGGVSKFVIGNSGLVGIGTTSPWAKLSVTGASDLGNFGYAGYFTATSTTATSTIANSLYVASSTPNGNAFFAVGSSSPLLWIDRNTGNLGIGTSSPWRTLSVNGTIGFSSLLASSASGDYLCINTTTYEVSRGAGAACTTSSERYKQNFEELAYGLNAVLKLHPIEFEYKPELNIGSGRRIGFLAEEVFTVMPELVVLDKDGLPSGVEYEKMAAVFAKAIQELNLKMDDFAAANNNAAGGNAPFDFTSSFFSFLDWLADKTVQAKEFIADKITARKAVLDALEMKDSVTGEVYCVRITNGEFEKFKGTCGEIIQEPVINEPATDTQTQANETTSLISDTASSTPSPTTPESASESLYSSETPPAETTPSASEPAVSVDEANQAPISEQSASVSSDFSAPSGE